MAAAFVKRVLRKRSVEFELGTAGLALAALGIGPMWMDYLHNNLPGESARLQAGIGAIFTAAALLILGRLIWIYRK